LSADQPSPARGLGVEGGANLLLLLLVVAIVLASGLWKSGTGATLLGVERPLEQWLRDGSLLAVAALSLAITPAGVRRRNDFSWAPMTEVATLFVGLFLTMIPVLAMLQAGPHAAFGDVFRAVSDKSGQPMPWAYFWASGVFSAFLDNAPTYLVFFNLAGGQVDVLTTTHAATLAAISAGCVFMGAATYIGNAPNLMIKAIAEQRGIAMPGFFGYMAWSGCVLMPMFVAMSWIWFR
jgi:Na+/H+ antiporter NhaD/arsenite permease-like protein